MDNNMNKLLRCPKCGEMMKRVISRKSNIPWVIAFEIVRLDLKFSEMYIFLCRRKHDGAFIMKRNFGKTYRKKQTNTA